VQGAAGAAVWQAAGPADATSLVKETHCPTTGGLLAAPTPTSTLVTALRLATRLHVLDTRLLRAAQAAVDTAVDDEQLSAAAAAYVELAPALLAAPPPPSASLPLPPPSTSLPRSPSAVAVAASPEQQRRGDVSAAATPAQPPAASLSATDGELAAGAPSAGGDGDGSASEGGSTLATSSFASEGGMSRAGSTWALAAADERVDGAQAEAVAGPAAGDAHALGLHWQVGYPVWG
jgi:hypothetical protein